MVKKKRPNTPLGDDSASNSVSGSAVPSPVTVTHDAAEEGKEDKKPPVFKHPNFQHSSKSSNKKRAWRSLKQIIAQERMLPWGDDYIHYGNIDAPPSFKPSKKYSDISGLLAKYKDPQTKLLYANAEEFSTIRSLPMDITAGYLSLRRANNPMG
ncbi:INO80 complex subunit C isoform X1 [Schistocerca cancellata]|uniref:INO80 complex subunit C isoform X1 n=1 Tax=Schistocerca cancellata TaxID=274614 RepID=UPI0021189FE9|nr:INO80 complex subunit C isoform X1 [Schistocerca cancellata]